MINAIQWFKEKGFTFNDKITIGDVIDLQKDAYEQASLDASEIANAGVKHEPNCRYRITSNPFDCTCIVKKIISRMILENSDKKFPARP